MSDTCTFCKILRSELPASFVYQDNDISAFLDIHPINSGHTLIIPNTHYEFFEQIPSQVFAKMTNTAQEIQKAFSKAGIIAEGSNVFLSNGEIAGQEVPHAHLHITPRYRGDGHRMGFSGTDPDPAARAELNQISKSISSALKQMDWMPPLLEGARILLRPIVEEDVEAIFEYCGDPEVSKFSTWQTHSRNYQISSDLSQFKDFQFSIGKLTDSVGCFALNSQLGYETSETEFTKRFLFLINHPEHTVIVSKNLNGEIVAWMHLALRLLLEDEHFAQLAAVVVRERERSLGLGAHLLKVAEEWSRFYGLKKIALNSSLKRERAHSFYLKNGYTHSKTSKSFVKDL